LARSNPVSPIVTDYVDFRDHFCHWVFNGGGTNAGLTNSCGVLVDEISRILRSITIPAVRDPQDELRPEVRALGNWAYRIRLLLHDLLLANVPPLAPMHAMLGAFRSTWSRRRANNWQRIREQAVFDLSQERSRWDSEANDLVYSVARNIDEQATILAVGHSQITVRALFEAQAAGTSFRLFHYCPGSEHPKGRTEPCRGCPLIAIDGQLVDKETAIHLISTGEITSVLAATCFYSLDREGVWITKGGRDVAFSAAEAMTWFHPVGGGHKRQQTKEAHELTDNVKRESAFVELVDINELQGANQLGVIKFLG